MATVGLVRECLLALNERKGSSVVRINKWLEHEKGVHVKKHLMKQALKSGVEKGLFQTDRFHSHSYRLTAVAKKPAPKSKVEEGKKKAPPKKAAGAKKESKDVPKKTSAAVKKAEAPKKAPTPKKAKVATEVKVVKKATKEVKAKTTKKVATTKTQPKKKAATPKHKTPATKKGSAQAAKKSPKPRGRKISPEKDAAKQVESKKCEEGKAATKNDADNVPVAENTTQAVVTESNAPVEDGEKKESVPSGKDLKAEEQKETDTITKGTEEADADQPKAKEEEEKVAV